MSADWYPRPPQGLGACEGNCDGARAKRRVRRANGTIERLCDACAGAVLDVATGAFPNNKAATATTDHYGGDI